MAKVIIEVEVDDSGAIKNVDELDKKFSKLKKSASQASEDGIKKVTENGGAIALLNSVTGGLAQTFKDAYDSIKLTNKGLSGTKAAIAATGVGALAVALGLVVQNFDSIVAAIKNVDAAADALTSTMAEGTKASQAYVTQTEALRNIVNDTVRSEKERKAALDELKKTIPELEAVELDQANALQLVNDEVQKSIDLAIKKARTDAILKRIAEEQNKITEATAKALSTESSLLATVVEKTGILGAARSRTFAIEQKANEALQQQEESQKIINLLTDEYEDLLSGLNVEEDEREKLTKKNTKAKIEQADATKQQAEAERFLAQVRKEQVDAERQVQEDIQAVRDFLDGQRIQSEEEKINERYERLREQANGETELLKELKMQQNYELGLLDQQRRQDEIDDEKAKNDRIIENEKKLVEQRVNNAKLVLNGIQSISEIFANSSERNARKQFAINKALGIADAVINTYSAIAGSLAQYSGPQSPPIPGYAIAQAIATGLFGFAQVKKIASQQFGGGASSAGGGRPPAGGGAGGATGAAPQPTAAIDFGLLNQQQQTPIPAYVIESNVTGAQEAKTRVKDLTTL